MTELWDGSALKEVSNFPLDVSADSQQNTQPETSQLLNRRREKGYSLEQIAKQLRISAFQAQALENLDFSQLPRPPYLQGFIRNYCRALDVNPSDYLALANNVVSPPLPVLKNDPQDLAGFDEESDPAATHTRRMWFAAMFIVVFTSIILLVVEFGPEQKLNNADNVKSLLPAVIAPLQTASNLPNAATVKPASVNVLQAVGANEQRLIRLTYRGDSWVEIRDAQGVVLTSQLNRRGSEQSLTGYPPLKMVIGAADNVAVEINGKALDLNAFTKENVARLSIP
ncbi:MAG: helix-turn-helix domain-containing protein [Burkholderiaceae bacterium]|nr:helix-turn-helix domain-containing protein [Burkholderiaceae bacterium]